MDARCGLGERGGAWAVRGGREVRAGRERVRGGAGRRRGARCGGGAGRTRGADWASAWVRGAAGRCGPAAVRGCGAVRRWGATGGGFKGRSSWVRSGLGGLSAAGTNWVLLGRICTGFVT
ncbi:hypothetical protein GCM10009743_40070 [Kribbella swartbergensis]